MSRGEEDGRQETGDRGRETAENAEDAEKDYRGAPDPPLSPSPVKARDKFKKGEDVAERMEGRRQETGM